MTQQNPIRPGFNWSHLFDLVNVPTGYTLTGATIQANLVTPDASALLVAYVTQSDAVGGADWAANRILVEFTAAATGAIQSQFIGQNALVQVFVTRDGKTHVYEAGSFPIRATKVAA